MLRDDDDDFDYVRTEPLERLKTEIETVANDCFIEVRLIGGLLKFTPIGVYTKLLLVLEKKSPFDNAVVIHSHRNYKLTTEHKGKAVSTSWVLGFLKHNASEAKEVVRSEKRRQQEVEKAKAELEHAASPIPRVKCEKCNGEGRWLAGDPSYGDAHFQYCSACHGAGYVDA